MYQQITNVTQTYNITGMTCGSCEARVKKNLLAVPGITGLAVSRETNEAAIDMQQEIPVSVLQEALGGTDSQYHITETGVSDDGESAKSWFRTYKPVLLIIGYIAAVALLIEASQGSFSLMRSMNNYMAGFFLVFSFFKLLNLRGFAENYARYDILAGLWQGWGYVYAFIELGLGLAFLTGFAPLVTNMITLLVMTISMSGVLRSVLNKRKIKCACLGDVFNLPMSTVTIIEDAHMICMSTFMILFYLL